MKTVSPSELLDRLCDEADRLLAKREGIHNQWGRRAAVYGWRHIYSTGGNVDWSNLDLMIRRMRWAAAMGQCPKKHDVLIRDSITWEDIDWE